MHHVVSINLAEVGYATLAGDSSKSFEAQPIGIATPQVSEAVLAAFSHLDDELRRRTSGTAVCFEHPSVGAPFVCLGASFPHAKDQFGREGLSFLHAVVCDDVAQLPHAALAVLQALGTTELERLAGAIARVAVERDEGNTFLAAWCDAMEGRVRRSPLPEQPARLKVVGTVEHDITGARSIANLALVLGRIGQPAGWCVRERFEDGRIVSVVEPPVDGIDRASVLLASSLTTLSQVEAPPESATAQAAVSRASPAPVPPEPTPTQVTPAPVDITRVDPLGRPRPATQPRRASGAPPPPAHKRAPTPTRRMIGASIVVAAAVLGLALGTVISMRVVGGSASPSPSVALPLQPTQAAPTEGRAPTLPAAPERPPPTPPSSITTPSAPTPPPASPGAALRPAAPVQNAPRASVAPARRVAPVRRTGPGGHGTAHVDGRGDGPPAE